MKRTVKKSVLCVVIFLVMLSWVCAVSNSEKNSVNDSQLEKKSAVLRLYEVNKKVSDFPDKEDFSTPEAACATIFRIWATGPSTNDWRRLSIKKTAERIPSDDKKTEVSPEESKRMLNAMIKEIRIYKNTLGVAFTEIKDKKGESKIDVRYLKLEDGKWLNSGHDGTVDNLERARELFGKVCAKFLPEALPQREKVEDPESYIKPFIAFLKGKGQDPKEFVMKSLPRYKLIIMSEIHHRPRYWAFNSSLVSNPAFSKHISTIYLELPFNDQPLVDQFLANEKLDTEPIINTLRDMFWMGWPDQAMLDFFTAVWKANQGKSPEQQIRIVLVDMERPWKEIRERGDWRQYHTDRDKLMAENILKDIREHPDEKRNYLFIVGVGHAMLDMMYPDQVTPMKKAGWYLREAMGRESVYAICPHMPSQTNMGRVDGRLCLGLFDTAFAAIDNKPVAFPLDEGPFGKQRFDAMPDDPTMSQYRNGYDAYLYLGPLEDEIFSPIIPDFYTREFVKEMDRRHRLMYGKGVVESGMFKSLTPDAAIAWMSNSWGQPRKTWKGGMGPINAWHYGDSWKDDIRREQTAYALEHPEIIQKAAQQLLESIKNADYTNPDTLLVLKPVPYMVDHWYDVWLKWIYDTFKENPIVKIELGDVHKADDGSPAVDYKLTLKDGKRLEGTLPFIYWPQGQRWGGKIGLDWHLQQNPFTGN